MASEQSVIAMRPWPSIIGPLTGLIILLAQCVGVVAFTIRFGDYSRLWWLAVLVPGIAGWVAIGAATTPLLLRLTPDSVEIRYLFRARRLWLEDLEVIAAPRHPVIFGRGLAFISQGERVDLSTSPRMSRRLVADLRRHHPGIRVIKSDRVWGSGRVE